MSKNGVHNFVAEIREIVRQHIADISTEKMCEIESINDDGTLNVYLNGDKSSVLHNIINQSRYNFKRGDYGYIYLIGNNLSNSFVFAKIAPKPQDSIEYRSGDDDTTTTIIRQVSGGGGGGGPTGPGEVATAVALGDGDYMLQFVELEPDEE